MFLVPVDPVFLLIHMLRGLQEVQKQLNREEARKLTMLGIRVHVLDRLTISLKTWH